MLTNVRRGLAVITAATVLSACSERDPFAPEAAPGTPESSLSLIQCRVAVASGELSCTAPSPVGPDGVRADGRVIGGQDVYVKLANTGTSYDGGTETFVTNVTVQNLTSLVIGTDGVTESGVKVFFMGDPVVTDGSGSVTLNGVGEDMFLGSMQEYYQYSQVLQPYEMSAPVQWSFDVPASVISFEFNVYVSAPMSAAPLLDVVWTGAVSSDWSDASNWEGGVLPTGRTVSVPTAAMPNSPVLSAGDSVAALRVGANNTLNLSGFTLQVTGNFDAVGAVSNGRIVLSGTNALVSGSVPALEITGSVETQMATVASGAVSIQDGTLTISGKPLSIRIP